MTWFRAFLETTTTINASPESVRKVCLDFENLSQWHRGFIQSTAITRHTGNQPVTGLEARPGDAAVVNAGGVVGEAIILQNSREVFRFAYTGRKMGLAAVRTFRFLPEETGGGRDVTVFKHSESWEGYMAVLFMAFSPLRFYVRSLFEGFNRDLKQALEEGRERFR